MVIKGSVFKLYFEQNVDLNLIKENLLSKQTKYQAEMDKISSRLKNKDFVKRAPKHIVELVVFINPGETTFSVIRIVEDAVQPPAVVAIATTSAPFGIRIGGVKFAG